MADDFHLTRDIYRKIKNSDRTHMELFLKSLYTQAVNRGFELAVTKNNIPFSKKELSVILLDDIKGISVDKAAEIIKVLSEKYELQQAEE